MGLLKCIECGHDVSEYADKCPNCGCPIDIIKNKDIKNNECVINNVKYDFSDIFNKIQENQNAEAIKLISSKCNIPMIDAVLVRDVIKFNNNKIPADYNKCLKLMQEKNSARVNRNLITCPNCKSSNVKQISTTERAASVIGLGIFSKKIGKSYKCLNCKYTW